MIRRYFCCDFCPKQVELAKYDNDDPPSKTWGRIYVAVTDATGVDKDACPECMKAEKRWQELRARSPKPPTTA